MTRTHLLAVCGLTAFAMFGCADAEPESADDDVELAINGGGVGYQPPQVFNDASGALTVFIKNCSELPSDIAPDGPVPAPPRHNAVHCALDPDFVLVGGGAAVAGQGEPGALLTESYPDPYAPVWHAASKDHLTPYPHKLSAYAIGLKVRGLTADQLRAHVKVKVYGSVTAQHPSQTVTVDPGTLLIGGGAAAVWRDHGLLLTASHPSADGRSWIAEAKDHKTEEEGTVTAYAIQISENIPGVGQLSARVFSQGRSVDTGYGEAWVRIDPAMVLTSVGGRSVTGGAGRLLTDVTPSSDAERGWAGARVVSKDHRTKAGGETVAYAIGLTAR